MKSMQSTYTQCLHNLEMHGPLTAYKYYVIFQLYYYARLCMCSICKMGMSGLPDMYT